MSNNIRILNLDPQEITINGAGTPTGITNVYVNGVDVTVGTKAYVIVPTKLSQLTNDEGFITNAEETDPTVPYYIKEITMADINAWNDKQDQLVSGSNIKTINNTSLLGSGDIQITATNYVAGTGIDITDNTISNTITSYQDLTDQPTIPTRTSQLINDSGFITNQVDDLEYYIPASILEDILPRVSDSGTDELYLEDSAPYKLKIELNPKEIEQYTTTGAQLFDKDNMNVIQDYYIDGTGTIVSGGNNKLTYIELEPSTTYYLRQNVVSSVTRRPALFDSVPVANATGTLITTVTGTNPIATSFTTTATDIYLAWVYCNTLNLNGHTEQEMIDSIMINAGATAETYEPYTGGMASPNPLYPQDLHVISGENSITVASKNLIPNNGTTTDTNGITFTVNSDGTVHVKGTATANAYLTYPSFNLKAGTYTLGAGVFVNTLTRIQLVEDIPTRPLLASTQSASSQSFTTTSDKTVFLQFRINNGEVIDTTFYPQLEIGSSATDYVTHQETAYPIDLVFDGLPIEYCKIGDYKDRFFKNYPNDPDYCYWLLNGEWVYKKAIGKIEMSNNANFTEVDNYTDYYSFTNNAPVETYNTPAGQSYAVSNYFLPFYDSTNNSNLYVTENSMIINIDSKCNITTTAELNTWLENNNPTAYVKIKDLYGQYYIPLYNTELEDQLEAIHNAIAYDGGTIISQTNDDLAFDITASTIQKVSN